MTALLLIRCICSSSQTDKNPLIHIVFLESIIYIYRELRKLTFEVMLGIIIILIIMVIQLIKLQMNAYEFKWIIFFFFYFLIVELTQTTGLPGGASGKEPYHRCRRLQRRGFSPWVGRIPWRRAWQPTPVFLPGESHGQSSLVATVHRVAPNRT